MLKKTQLKMNYDGEPLLGSYYCSPALTTDTERQTLMMNTTQLKMKHESRTSLGLLLLFSRLFDFNSFLFVLSKILNVPHSLQSILYSGFIPWILEQNVCYTNLTLTLTMHCTYNLTYPFFLKPKDQIYKKIYSG